MFFAFCKTKAPLCSFCYSYDETIKLIFLEFICKTTAKLFKLILSNDISFPILTPQTFIFGFINRIENNVYKIISHILLIFKLHVYKSRALINEIKKVKLLEKKSAQNHV